MVVVVVDSLIGRVQRAAPKGVPLADDEVLTS